MATKWPMLLVHRLIVELEEGRLTFLQGQRYATEFPGWVVHQQKMNCQMVQEIH